MGKDNSNAPSDRSEQWTTTKTITDYREENERKIEVCFNSGVVFNENNSFFVELLHPALLGFIKVIWFSRRYFLCVVPIVFPRRIGRGI